MKYTTKDIIRQALSIADLENTKQFSHIDLTNLLNQAWKQANQALINKGCHYFYKTIDLSGPGLFNLPDDFYQLGSIVSGGTVVPRQTSLNDTFCYDIIGNMLDLRGVGKVKLGYYTSPVFLSYKDANKNWDKPEDLKSVETASGDWILYRNTNLDLVSYNIKTGDYKRVAGFAMDECLSGDNLIYIKSTFGEETTLRCFISWENMSVVYTLADDENVISFNGNLFTYKATDSRLLVYGNGRLITSFDINYKPDGICFTSGDNILGFIKNNLTDLRTGDSYSVEDKNFIKPIRGGFIIDLNILVNGEFESTDVEAFNIYGIVTDGFLADNYIIDPTPDTLLDFPNTLFFEYLSAVVAYLMVLKTGGSTDSVTSQLSIAEYAFYDSIDNSGNYKVIRNVY